MKFLELLTTDKRELERREREERPWRRRAPTYLGELVERGIGGVVGDEELHATVGDLYCGGAIHVGETASKTITIQLLQNTSNFWLRSQKEVGGDSWF